MRTPPWWAAPLLPVLPVLVVAGAASSAPLLCPQASAVEEILGFPEACSPLLRPLGYPVGVGVIEGDEAALARTINALRTNKEDFAAVLFYASWCPFSQECRPRFEELARIFPTIRHFAFEKSTIRPSMIVRFGIHGYPTLFLINSTMRMRYHGPRTVKSLAAFYSDVSGFNPSTIGDGDKLLSSDSTELGKATGNMLQQDTYLALAASFVILRLLNLHYPKIIAFVKRAWSRCAQNPLTLSKENISSTRYAHLSKGTCIVGPGQLGLPNS